MTFDPRRLRLPAAESTARQLALGRTAVAAFLMAAPVTAQRLIGLDTGTAQRIAWLTRLTAVRDGALGVGALAAGRAGEARSWVVAGAVSDAVDALVIAAALKQGRLRGVRPALVVPASAAVAAVGAAAALGLRRN
jgi:hypothetical protein